MMRILLSLCLVLMLLVLVVSPVLAIDDPDTPPEVRSVYVYEDLLTDGDLGVLIEYFLDYTIAGIPDETVTEAYLAAFVDTDGTTQLGAVAPYLFVNSGYGRGLVWIYFSNEEVTTLAIDSADEALYSVLFTGNPTLDWDADPPKITANIDDWNSTGEADSSVVLGLKVLELADSLGLSWTLELVSATPLGNKLTTLGESYFYNVIPNLSSMAPNVASAGELDPIIEDIDYTTTLGAILTDGTGTAAGSPITLVDGNNNVDVQVLGTFTIELEKGTIGTATTDVCTVTGSPVDLVVGTNTITTTTAIGNIVVAIEQQDTQTAITDTVTGTALDLSLPAATFGMSTMMFSGLVWFIITVLICAAVYRGATAVQGGSSSYAGKVIMIVFDVCIIGGALLGLLSIIAAVLLFIGFAVFSGYILFFRGANV